MDAEIIQLAGCRRFDIVNRAGLGLSGGANPPNYNPGGVANNNQGNTRDANGDLVYNYNPIIASASVTYTLDSFPLYKGAFPIKIAGEYMNNPGADPATGSANNEGYWGGIHVRQIRQKRTPGTFPIATNILKPTLGTTSWWTMTTWLSIPTNPPNWRKIGWVGGTNIKGHLIKFDYSLADALTFSFTAYINELINGGLNTGGAGESKNDALHVMADLMWKF